MVRPISRRSLIIVPGLGGSGPDHWQSWLERQIPGAARISDVDWERPQLSLWMDRLRSSIRRQPGGIVVAHSLGCALVAHVARAFPDLPVGGALLVAPADIDASPIIPETLRGFADVPSDALPFPSIVIASANDPYMSQQRADYFASSWGARLIHYGACGHINVASGFGAWPDGLRILSDFARGISASVSFKNVTETERT